METGNWAYTKVLAANATNLHAWNVYAPFLFSFLAPQENRAHGNPIIINDHKKITTKFLCERKSFACPFIFVKKSGKFQQHTNTNQNSDNETLALGTVFIGSFLLFHILKLTNSLIYDEKCFLALMFAGSLMLYIIRFVGILYTFYWSFEIKLAERMRMFFRFYTKKFHRSICVFPGKVTEKNSKFNKCRWEMVNLLHLKLFKLNLKVQTLKI